MASPNFVGLAALISCLLFLQVAVAVFKRKSGRALLWALFSVGIISLTFGLFYSAGECIASLDDTVEPEFFDCVYFSVMTLTNVGYGEYWPSTSYGKALAMIEGFAGFIFLGVFVTALYDQVHR